MIPRSAPIPPPRPTCISFFWRFSVRLSAGPRGMNFEEILDAVGGFGRYQKTLYVWICLPQILLAFHMMVSVFTGATPPHRCRSARPGVPSWNLTRPDALELRLANFSELSSADSCSVASAENQSVRSGCEEGWVYSHDVFETTTVTEIFSSLAVSRPSLLLNSVSGSAQSPSPLHLSFGQAQTPCVANWLDLIHFSYFPCGGVYNISWTVRTYSLHFTASVSIYMLGLLVGAVVFGAMADRYGRRFALLLSLALQTVFGVAAAFSPNFLVYVILRFIIGTTISGVIINAFVLGTEWTSTKRRMLAGIFTDYFFGFGYMLLAGVAYLIRDWRKLQLAISVPGFLFIFYIWVVPHSARWLLVNDRKEEAFVLLRKAAMVNGRAFPTTVQLDRCDVMQGRGQHSAVDLLRTPEMRKRALILYYIWFVNVLVYYGLSLGVSGLGTDLYLTQFMFGLVEIPARSLVLLVLPFSRRLSLTVFLFIGGVACLLMLAVPADTPNVQTALAMTGKFGITASFAIIYIYSAELFPTVLRQTGIGVSSMFARMGGVLAPMINLLGGRNPVVLVLIFGSTPLLGAALALALPETANRPLPDTIEDAERFTSQKHDQDFPADSIQSPSSTEGQELHSLTNESP